MNVNEATRQDCRRMITEQLIPRGISSERVLQAFGRVPRERFFPAAQRGQAYADGAFPIAGGQTISQPYIVALMTQLLAVEPGDAVLEIGTGSGYQTAILAELGARVYTVEQDADLAREAQQLLGTLGYSGIHFSQGNGWEGWAEFAPYRGIIVTCAPTRLPEKLGAQLAPGGRLVLPIGPAGEVQQLFTYRKSATGELGAVPGIPVKFVPMLE